MILSKGIDTIGDWNPQLFRELKGRLTTRNITLTATISLIGQMLIFFIFKGKLPPYEPQRQFTNRYCLGTPPDGWNNYPDTSVDNFCIPALGDWMINWQLWWLDIYITLSVVGIIGLLVVGVYLLIVDLSKEENQGTLNFIRLSPQSARGLFVGKLLGIPSLVYFAALLGIPFHLMAGFKANISLELMLGFYGVIIASCVFFFNAALLFGLVSPKLGSLQAFVISGGLLMFLLVMLGITQRGDYISETPFDWLALFNPTITLPYLVKSSFIASRMAGYFPIQDIHDLHWYGQAFWQHSGLGIGFIIANFGLWSYGITQGLKRRFHNPSETLLSKSQSYQLSTCFIIFLSGFVFQTTDSRSFHENMQMLQALLGVFMIILIAALSPHRQTIHDLPATVIK